MKLPVALIALILLFQTGCSLDLKTFGSKTLSSELPSTSVKGSFPLGEPEFTGAQKYSLSVTPSNQFVFFDNSNVIHVLSSAGQRLRTITIAGIYAVDSLTTDNSGNILVTGKYTSNGDAFLMKYSITGQFLGELVRFPAFDTGGGVYGAVMTRNLKVGPDGSIFMRVEDTTQRIEKYSPAGVLLQTYANVAGTSDGQFFGVENFIPNADGTLYVVDSGTNRVQLLNANGTYNSKFTWPQQDPTSLINGFIKNNDGTFVLIEDSVAGKFLHKFSATGAPIWMLDGSEAGGLYSWQTPSVVKYNGKYHFTVGETLYVYSENGISLNVYKRFMNHPTAVARAKDGTFFITDDNTIYKYSATGTLQDTFGSGSLAQIMHFSEISKTLYVAQLQNGTVINKYDVDGNSLGTVALGAGQVYGMCTDKDENLFVSTSAGLVEVLKSNGTVNTLSASIFTGLSCNSDGTLYALYYDSVNTVSVLQKMNATGTVLQTFDHSGAGAIGVTYGLSVSNGYAVVADNGSNKIFVFNTADGSFVRSFGSTGGSALNAPWGIVIDIYNEIFVADSGNHFVKKFSLSGTLLTE